MKIAKEDKMAYTLYLCIALIAVALASAGCATFNRLVQNDALLMQLSTQAATARVLHEHPGWRDDVIDVTSASMAVIDAKVVVDLQSVETFVKGKIDWTAMRPEEQALVTALMSEVRKNIEDSLRAKSIKQPELQLVEVRTFLGWIRETATLPPAK
jgi:hypothetical protein